MLVEILLTLLGGFAVYAALLGTISWTFNKSISGGLVNATELATVSANAVITANQAVLAGQAGTLTTMSTSTTGTATMGAGHGLTTGQRVDIYWATGQCYGAILGTVSGTTVPIASVSGGSALPANGTAIVISPCASAPFEAIGDNLQALLMTCGTTAGYVVISTNSADLLAKFLQPNASYNWKLADGTNPLAGGVPTKVWFSTSGTVANSSMQAAALTN